MVEPFLAPEVPGSEGLIPGGGGGGGGGGGTAAGVMGGGQAKVDTP